MDDLLSEEWAPTLRYNGLGEFDDLWGVDAPWFEPPNHRRGGWSGVARLELATPDGATRAVFLKRQQNHWRRTLTKPFRGELTFEAELRNMLALQDAGVPSLQPVFFGRRKVEGGWRAILVTRELGGYRPLDDWLEQWRIDGSGHARRLRRRVIAAAARLVARLHRHSLVHNALYPKHLFVRIDAGDVVDVRLIDLEKMRRVATPRPPRSAPPGSPGPAIPP